MTTSATTTTEEFNDVCDAFTMACVNAANWRHRYSGAVYSTRLFHAITAIEAAIVRAKRHPDIAKQFNEAGLANLATVRSAIKKSDGC
jgi:hypothetical protein